MNGLSIFLYIDFVTPSKPITTLMSIQYDFVTPLTSMVVTKPQPPEEDEEDEEDESVDQTASTGECVDEACSTCS